MAPSLSRRLRHHREAVRHLYAADLKAGYVHPHRDDLETKVLNFEAEIGAKEQGNPLSTYDLSVF
jgi:hypothetical protein